jgi:ribosome-binding protein aMBF1 (putative translation factor)
LILSAKDKWSKEDLAYKIGTSVPIIGRYERDDIISSIEITTKIDEVLDVFN